MVWMDENPFGTSESPASWRGFLLSDPGAWLAEVLDTPLYSATGRMKSNRMNCLHTAPDLPKRIQDVT